MTLSQSTSETVDSIDWTTGEPLPDTVGYSQAAVTRNRIYLLGGFNGSNYLSTVYTAPILPDGALGPWTTGTPLPSAVSDSQAVVTRSRIYLLGGLINGSPSSTVYTAPILPDGTLGDWTTAESLPGNVTDSQAVVTRNRVYLLGGTINRNVASTVYTAPILPDGTLGTWTTGISLPETVFYSQAMVTCSRVYLLGGFSGNGSSSSTVYTAPILSDGTLGDWTTGTSLPGTVSDSQTVVTRSRVYLLGGRTINDSPSSTVYTAPILSDGTLGTWTTGTPLPGIVIYSQAVVTPTRIYLLGGYVDGKLSSKVYVAALD